MYVYILISNMCASDCKLIMKHMGTPQIYDLETPDLTFKFFYS